MKKLLLFTVFFILTVSTNAGYRSISRSVRANEWWINEYVTSTINTGGSFYLKLDVFSSYEDNNNYVCAQLRKVDDDVLASVDIHFYDTPAEIRLNATPFPYIGSVYKLWTYFYLGADQTSYSYAVVTLTW